jgi:hypothetical protein
VRHDRAIENGLHRVLDVAFREDHRRVREAHAAKNQGVLRHIAVNLLKQKSSRRGIRAGASWPAGAVPTCSVSSKARIRPPGATTAPSTLTPRRHRGRITFWGELDRQATLPFGTPQEVRRDVQRVRRALDTGAGGVIAELEWGNEVPMENVIAAFEAWEEPLGGCTGGGRSPRPGNGQER